jgi:hypothetical protein
VKQLGQPFLRNSEYLDVDIFGRSSSQLIANPSPDHERAAASRGGSLRNAAHGVE